MKCFSKDSQPVASWQHVKISSSVCVPSPTPHETEKIDLRGGCGAVRQWLQTRRTVRYSVPYINRKQRLGVCVCCVCVASPPPPHLPPRRRRRRLTHLLNSGIDGPACVTRGMQQGSSQVHACHRRTRQSYAPLIPFDACEKMCVDWDSAVPASLKDKRRNGLSQ